MNTDQLFQMIIEAAEHAKRAVRPGDQSFIAFTVFINQLATLRVELPEPSHD